MTAAAPIWPREADVPPSPFSVRASWPPGAVRVGGAHRIADPRADDLPTVPFLFTHPALYSGTDPVPGGTL